MKTLLITRTLPEAVMTEASAQFDVTCVDDGPLDAAAARDALLGYDAVLTTLGDDFSAAAFPDQPRCGVLANFGVGYNHIDVAAARAAGVAVSNTPGAVTDATADIALTLMLMSCRRAAEGERLVRAGQWTGWEPTQMLGLHMSGKVLGVIGMGRIGQAIARRAALGFGMQVVFYNRSPKTVPDIDARQVNTLAEVASVADVVVVAVPGGADTRHIVNADVLAAMQPHAHLINIARGDVVDEAALIEALQQRRIGGAGLDVYEREPIVPDALRALDNVTLLPHLGTAALEVREAMGRMALANAVAWAQGDPLPNPVS